MGAITRQECREATVKRPGICAYTLFAVAEISAAQWLPDNNVEYSATSYLESWGPGASSYQSALTIHQAPQMLRFQSPDNKQAITRIFRSDKNIVWIVHPENRLYPGVRKYQEVRLGDGTGFDSHIDNLMRAFTALKNHDGLKNLGKETVAGIATTHYQERDPVPWLSHEFVVTNYWVSDSGVLMKVNVSGPDISSTIEMQDIQFEKQPADLFVPPPGYEKAGQMINWAEEARKLDAADLRLKDTAP